MVVINEDEPTPQNSNATNQSTTSEITSSIFGIKFYKSYFLVAESDQMEQERQGHKFEASISSMKLSPPAALISPLPEKFMQNFDLPLQNGEKEIQVIEIKKTVFD
jgi:hypothetical protein